METFQGIILVFGVFVFVTHISAFIGKALSKNDINAYVLYMCGIGAAMVAQKFFL